MKKIILMIFLMLQFLTYAKNEYLHTLKNLSFQVKEETTLDGAKKELIYKVILEFPDKMKKTMISPEINKGEIYLYDKDEKIVYLPFFNQIEKSKISPEENRVLEFIKTLIDMEKNNMEFREKYYNGKGQKIKIASGEMVEIKSGERLNGYFFPKEIDIFSDNIKISNLVLSNFKNNIRIREDEFKIKNENSK
ncbi:MAG: LolA family protein [Fusobacteriaceae bacterium]